VLRPARSAVPQRELASKAREADVAVQRLHQLQAELQLARTEAHETREVSELRHAVQRERERISGLPSTLAPAHGGVHVALMPQTQAAHGGAAVAAAPYDDELDRSDLWDFSAGAMARQGRGGSDPKTVLPRIRSPFNTASANTNAPG
jgi:hypothetical protein